MDFQKLADSFQTVTCVISVERKDDGYGEIRIAAANQMFLDAAGIPAEEYVPNSTYHRNARRDLNFEDLCYRAAVLKKPVHTYIHPNKSQFWFNVFAMPLAFEEGNLCYCTYTQEKSELADIDLTSTLSAETSADVLKTCIRLHDTNDFRKTMQEVIQDIRAICDAAVCTIMLMDFTAETCAVLATDIKDKEIKRVTQFGNLYNIAASWLDTIGDNDCLIVKNEQDMKYISEINHPWYVTLEEAHVNSVVMFPLRYNNEVHGYIWATNFDTRYVMRIKETLELTTFFLSSEIASYKMMKRLEHISFTDLLTGVSNRNAMNNRISGIVEGTETLPLPFGIVFADLNGLKRVNDEEGHAAGDLLLKKAALLLQERFTGDEIYRAGGDEFMVMISDCTAENFAEKVEALRESSSDPDNVCFAIGCCFTDTECDIRDVMRRADEDMYRNKAQYYTEHPERRHR